jgi:chromate transporter
MVILDLFLGFLEVGCFAFGGAYGAIPLIRDVVLSHSWLSDDLLTDMIAVSESTPGPIMINLATYVGYHQGGFLGAVATTAAVVLPSFLIILLVTALLQHFLDNRYIQGILRGMKPCVAGIVLATGLYMVAARCFGNGSGFQADFQAILLTLVLIFGKWGYQQIGKKKLSPIRLILASAVLGVLVYGL